MKPLQRQHRSGFTLIEIMVSIAILGLVVVAIYSSWTAILRASKVGLEAAAAAQRSRIALQTIEDSLTTATLSVRNADYYGFVVENGSEAILSFVARLPKSFPRSGRFGDFDLRRLTFSVEPGEHGEDDLVLRQQPLVMDMDEDEENFPLILARNVKEFQIGLWEPRVNDWIDEWQQTNQLPKLVMIKLSLQHTDARSVRTVDEVTRVIALTSSGVLPMFQGAVMPNAPGMPGAPGVPGIPGAPGVGVPGSGLPPVIPSPPVLNPQPRL